MAHIIDRRLNPKGKSLGNRQRFIRRAKDQIREAVKRSIEDKKIQDVSKGDKVSIPTKGIGEPHFRHSRKGGFREGVFPGNKEFEEGDHIPRPEEGSGAGGRQGSNRGDGEDDFQFTLTRDEFLDIFFEDLELPDLVKTSLKEIKKFRWHHAGYTTVGTPASLNVLQSMRYSLGRRIALGRPKKSNLDAIMQEIFELENKSNKDPDDLERLQHLHEQVEIIGRRMKRIPFIDPFDIRYNLRTPTPEPNTSAVMLCLMDVSGSMGEREKDLAKRFFMLLYMFLERQYERIEIVFIRHTHEAKEVEEEEFFYSRETGGTVVSKGLELMLQVIRDRYPVDEWNIYAAQASDGENWRGDSEICVDLLNERLMPLMQYFAYIEIIQEQEAHVFQTGEIGADLWRAYEKVSGGWKNFAMKRISKPGDIFPVFHELFKKEHA